MNTEIFISYREENVKLVVKNCKLIEKLRSRQKALMSFQKLKRGDKSNIALWFFISHNNINYKQFLLKYIIHSSVCHITSVLY